MTTSAAGDTIVTTAKNDLVTGAAGTLATADRIVDASTTDKDTLNLTFDAADILKSVVATGTNAATITNIENVNVNIDAFAGTATTFNATNVKGATITLSSSKLGFNGEAGVAVAGANNVTAGTNITALTVAGLTKGMVDAGSAKTLNLSGTATETLNLTVNGDVTSTTITANGKDTSITATADAVVTIITTANFGTSTDVKGSGNLTLKGVAVDLTTETITNSGTGTLSINITDDNIADLSKVASSNVILSAAAFTKQVTLNNNNSTVTTTDLGTGATFVVDSTDTIETLTIKTSDATIGAAVLNDVEVTNLVLGADTTITALEGEGTLNLSGTADVTMTSAAATKDMAVVDASALVGKLNYTTVTGSTQTVKGTAQKTTLTTAGDDTVTFVGLNAGNVINANTATGTLSVETGTGVDTLNVKALVAGGKIVGTLGAGDDIVKFSDLATQGISHVTAQFNIDGGTGSDTLVLQNATNLGTISALSTVTGFEKITLAGTVADATVATTVTIAGSIVSGNTMVVTGTANSDSLTISGLTATAQTIDLSGITFDAVKAVETVAVTGGSEADVITGFSGVTGITAYTINAGAGNDTIIVGASSTNSTITAGAGNDTIDLTGATGIQTLIWGGATGGKDTVTGWGAADKINVEATGAGAGNIGFESADTLAAKGTFADTTAYILSTNGTAGNLTIGGTAKVTDWTDLTDVAAYLSERYTTAANDDGLFIVNDTTTSANTTYIYNFVQSATANTTVDADELVLTGVIDNGGVILSVANVDFTA